MSGNVKTCGCALKVQHFYYFCLLNRYVIFILINLRFIINDSEKYKYVVKDLLRNLEMLEIII